MPNIISVSDRYRAPIWAGLAWVTLSGIFSVLTLDMGEAFTIFRYSLHVYSVLILLILLRRPLQPTTTDLLTLKWGFPTLYSVGLMVYPYVWHLRGLR